MKRYIDTTIEFEVGLHCLASLPQYSTLSNAFRWGLELLETDQRYPHISQTLVVDVRVYAGKPAKVYGPPEDCYPAEPAYAEAEVTKDEERRFYDGLMFQVESMTHGLMEGPDNGILAFLVTKALEVMTECAADNFSKLLSAELSEEEYWR